MKSFQVAGKALTVVFAAILLVACAGNQEAEEQAAAQARAAEEARVEEAARVRRAEEAKQREAAERAEREAMESLTSVFHFDFDQSTLSSDVRAALDEQIAYLKSNTRNIVLEGHADERGTRDYNMALGERRAKAVADYMVVNGIASYRIEAKSYGEERPLAHGSGESSWRQNRRVELK